MKNLGLIFTFIMVGLLAFIGITLYFTYNNEEIQLRKECDAQLQKIETTHDKMWKVIQQKAQVSNEYKDAFAEIYPELIAGRYSEGGGGLMMWIKESNPEFDTSLYKDLMSSIEILRTEFQTSQERMIDLKREHDVLCTTYPSKWFISNKTLIDYTPISSTKSKNVMETGVDDDVNLF